jgi:hypothetical protein
VRSNKANVRNLADVGQVETNGRFREMAWDLAMTAMSANRNVSRWPGWAGSGRTALERPTTTSRRSCTEIVDVKYQPEALIRTQLMHQKSALGLDQQNPHAPGLAKSAFPGAMKD